MPKWKGDRPKYMWPRWKNNRWDTFYRRKGKYTLIQGTPGTAEWWANYAEIHKTFEPAKREGPTYGTLAHVAVEYQNGPKWSKLANKTRTTYRTEIDELLSLFGDAQVDQITRSVIVGLRDKVAETKSPRAAIERIKVLRILLGQAYDMDLVDRNHARNIGKPIGYKAEPWRHWEDEEISLFLSHAAPRWRRAVNVLLHTGLRVGDAIRVRRSDIKDNVLRWVANKTGTPVVIPLHSQLKFELSLPMEVESVYLLASQKGLPFKLVTSINHGIVREFKRLGIEKPPPIHGLRKNAVMRLLEAGCEVDDVHAVTGQSREMIAHYGQKYDRERRARAAILKLELYKS